MSADPDPPSDRRPDALRPEELTEAVDRLGPPPIGVVLISVEAQSERIEGDAGSAIEPTPSGDRIAREVAAHLAERIHQPDVLAIDEQDRIVVARAGLRAPSATDGLAHNLHDELSRTRIVGDRAVRWRVTIGAATSLAGDTGPDVVGYATRALDEAHLLGGDRVVIFDDVDRELLPDR